MGMSLEEGWRQARAGLALFRFENFLDSDIVGFHFYLTNIVQS